MGVGEGRDDQCHKRGEHDEKDDDAEENKEEAGEGSGGEEGGFVKRSQHNDEDVNEGVLPSTKGVFHRSVVVVVVACSILTERGRQKNNVGHLRKGHCADRENKEQQSHFDDCLTRAGGGG